MNNCLNQCPMEGTTGHSKHFLHKGKTIIWMNSYVKIYYRTFISKEVAVVAVAVLRQLRFDVTWWVLCLIHFYHVVLILNTWDHAEYQTKTIGFQFYSVLFYFIPFLSFQFYSSVLLLNAGPLLQSCTAISCPCVLCHSNIFHRLLRNDVDERIQIFLLQKPKDESNEQ